MTRWTIHYAPVKGQRHTSTRFASGTIQDLLRSIAAGASPKWRDALGEPLFIRNEDTGERIDLTYPGEEELAALHEKKPKGDKQ